ncbi:MAG TPA: AAA family ATPase [Gaiellaceae bacterium]|nr:AAA family ATPase [Gaiellaceae bacterium]
MTITFRPAKRGDVMLLVSVAGGTGSGKTMSSLRLGRGLAGGKPFVGIDTENGRMSHYADRFPELQVGEIHAPFRPDAYTDAIAAGVEHLKKAGVPAMQRVIVVDSASHEWYGDGGCLDWQEELMRGEESRRLMSWIEPKKAHKRMVTRLLQVEAHVILCFRAEPKVEAVRGSNGRIEIVPKATLTGLDGWVPISEKNLPFEMTLSFLLMADRPGVPRPIKLEEEHRPLVKLDEPLSEETGRALAAWAAGAASARGVTAPAAHAASADVEPLTVEQLKEKLQAAGISRSSVVAAGKALFPDKASASDLTDEERGRVWQEVSRAA